MEKDIDALKRTQEIIKDLKICMMSTETPEGRIQSRPMNCQKLDDEGYLWFFASKNSDRTVAFDYDENVNLAFACPEKARYLSIIGTAEVYRDRGKIDSLWSPDLSTWFPKGKADPQLCLIRVHALSAEYWDSPSLKAVRLFELDRAT